MKMMFSWAVVSCLAALSGLVPSTVGAQGAAFTYQGQLLGNGGVPANGSYDLAFTLYNTNLNGVVIGGPVTNTATGVTNGLFTTIVNFGPGVFTGGSNWLQIAVSTNGANSFTPLTPRQQVTPVPYAVYATTASNVSGTVSAGQINGTLPQATLPAAVVTNTETGVTLGGIFSGSGAGLTALNASQLSSGTVPLAQLSGITSNQLNAGTWQLATNLNGGNAALATNVVAGIGVTNAFITNSVFAGNGGGLTNLNASQLAGGVVSTSVLPGFQGGDNAIGGGVGNTINGVQSAILGGQSNTNNANQSAIGGGNDNVIQPGAYYAYIGGGSGGNIQTNAYDSVINGGYHNTVGTNAIVSVIGGGQFNTISNNASFAVLGGGLNNTNTGSYSVIPGGEYNVAAANSLAAGTYAQATNSGSFVWSDNSTNSGFGSATNNSFNVRASGGVAFVTGGNGVAVDGASVLTATAGSIQQSEINDGGSAAYTGFQQAIQAAGGDTTLAFSQVYPVTATNAVSPSLVLAVNGTTVGTVAGFSGYEGISQPYAYVVEVQNSTTITPSSEIGQTASLTYTRNGNVTTFGGTVTACTLAASTSAGYVYTFKIESPLANLNLTTDYNIYLNLSAPAVATQVYASISPSAPLTSSLTGAYVTHESLTQYGETALNFFSRILENEGVFYFFNQSASPPSLVLGDNTGAYLTGANSSFPYYGNTATNITGGTEYIRTFQNAAMQTTKTATVNAYNFKTPDTLLRETTQLTTGVGLYYEFGNALATTSYDTTLAQTRAGVQTENRVAITGTATAPDLRAGYTFTLTDQTGAGLGGNYLITGVHHAAFVRVTNGVSTFFYGNEFTAVPASVDYQPPLRATKPMALPCTAVVSGAAGEEIDVDAYGRVKVLFHWDHYDTASESSSAWIRVASPWAGSGRGVYFSPRIGDEVLVSFLQGDPDQPVVVGSLYNADNTVPYPLPGDKTWSGILTSSSPGGGGDNELRFEDGAGSELIYLQAQKDMTQRINNNLNETVGASMTLNVTSGLNITAGTQITLNGPVAVNGTIAGNGSGLTNLNASQLTSGVMPSAALPASAAQLGANQTFTGDNTFDNDVAIVGAQTGSFGTPLVLMDNNNTTGSTAPTLRLQGYGNSPYGVLSVSSQGTGLIADFGNANSFVADITTNGTFEAPAFNGGSLRVGAGGTTFTNIESGQAIMPSSSLVETNFTVTFPQAFSSAPKVIASISGDPNYATASDVFTMSIRAVTSGTGFTVNVYRVDSPTGWSQQLRINWQAWQ